MKNIFVGNLNFRTSEDEVRGLFAAYGSVDRVNLITDRETGQPRGFGFVEMSNDAEADRAISELNGRDVGGRAINVNEARPKEDRGGGGGGGGRGRGGGGGGRGRYESQPFSIFIADPVVLARGPARMRVEGYVSANGAS